jgi:hypothetical protein
LGSNPVWEIRKLKSTIIKMRYFATAGSGWEIGAGLFFGYAKKYAARVVLYNTNVSSTY